MVLRRPSKTLSLKFFTPPTITELLMIYARFLLFYLFNQYYDFLKRCLNPGNYTKYLHRWLSSFPARQMIIVDGNALKTEPIPLLNRFQKQIDVEQFIDYKKLIEFDNKKGFYCPIKNGKSQCLGISKVQTMTHN